MLEHLVYVTTARLPTEKANGLQISRMCEAFARSGMAVTLLHPYRYQSGAALRALDLFDAYGVERLFAVETLANLDVRRLEHLLPSGLAQVTILLSNIFWSRFAVREAIVRQGELYYARDIPVAYWMAEYDLPFALELHSVPRGIQRSMLRRVMSARSLRLLAPLTHVMAGELRKLGAPEEKLIVLPDAVAPELFAARPSREECRRRCGLPQDREIIGFVGRFSALGGERGIEELISSVGLLGERAHSVTLLCVGGPLDALHQDERAIADSGLRPEQVVIRDRVPPREVPLWMGACDIGVIPSPPTPHYSRYSSPLKLFEYMAAGLPIVASDLPALREILAPDTDAILVEAASPQALSAGLRRLLEDPELRARLARRVSERSRDFTWQNRARRVLTALGYREQEDCSRLRYQLNVTP